jgi:hypothetical protein
MGFRIYSSDNEFIKDAWWFDIEDRICVDFYEIFIMNEINTNQIKLWYDKLKLCKQDKASITVLKFMKNTIENNQNWIIY